MYRFTKQELLENNLADFREYMVNGQKTSQLFNLRKDPFELYNLESNSKCHLKLTEMKTALTAQKKIYNDLN